MLVYVLNHKGKPLMPCSPRKARLLLKQGKVKVTKRIPFTIQWIVPTRSYIQPITLGVDAGYLKIGLSAVSKGKELLSGEVQLRKGISKKNDVSEKLSERRMYRRNRRNKLWYRKPRFDNRISSKKKGWLAPSIQHKLDSNIKAINKVREILPISDIVVEVASFDTQKIKNPDIKGKEYQDGEQKGFYNVKAYVRHRDNYTCQHCKGKSKDKILQVHHIRGRKEGATDRPEELITVCRTCHKKHHNGTITITAKPIKTFKAETFMSTVRGKLLRQLNSSMPDSVSHTYGYITKYKREQLGLEKSHINDAFVIANGTEQKRCKPFTVTQTRRNNRSIQTNRKGYKPSIRKQRYKYQPNDMVRFNKKIYKVKGIFNYGTWVRLSDNFNIINTNIKNVSLVSYGKGLQFRYPIHLPPNSNVFGRSLLG